MLLYTVSDLTTWEDLDADVSTTLKQISGQDQMALNIVMDLLRCDGMSLGK